VTLDRMMGAARDQTRLCMSQGEEGFVLVFAF
jgi:hypothetical protein